MTRNYKVKLETINQLSEASNIEYRDGFITIEGNPSDDEIKAIVEARILSESNDILDVTVYLEYSSSLNDVLVDNLSEEYKAIFLGLLDELYVAGDSEQTHLNVANLISKLIK
jgi:hypothetical protein